MIRNRWSISNFLFPYAEFVLPRLQCELLVEIKELELMEGKEKEVGRSKSPIGLPGLFSSSNTTVFLFSLMCELLVETKELELKEVEVEGRSRRSNSILLFLFIKFGLPNLHSILEPLAILYIRDTIKILKKKTVQKSLLLSFLNSY
jgi:hypothetical protein